MITEKDLLQAIAECQGERNPNANTCIKLAAYYTIQKAMFGEDSEPEYSFASSPTIPIVSSSTVSINIQTEFAQTINGMEQSKVWPVVDELMETLKAMQPRLYKAVMSKL